MFHSRRAKLVRLLLLPLLLNLVLVGDRRFILLALSARVIPLAGRLAQQVIELLLGLVAEQVVVVVVVEQVVPIAEFAVGPLGFGARHRRRHAARAARRHNSIADQILLIGRIVVATQQRLLDLVVELLFVDCVVRVRVRVRRWILLGDFATHTCYSGGRTAIGRAARASAQLGHRGRIGRCRPVERVDLAGRLRIGYVAAGELGETYGLVVLRARHRFRAGRANGGRGHICGGAVLG